MKFLFILLLTSSLAHASSNPKGTYSNGSLEDADCLPESGEGFMQLHRDWDRIWGTTDMVKMITETGKEMNEKFPNRDRLQVEDIAAKHGGEIDGHGSHENGLDVDIQFYKNDGIEHDPKATNEDYAPEMITSGRVSENFDVERNWALMKTLHKHGNVQRIFIDQGLKKKLCSYAKEKGELVSAASVLRSLRHEENHQDHLHVRLRCPKNARSCVPQADPSPGTGCQ
jgi:penicillin-insensitive murein endopeptidase